MKHLFFCKKLKAPILIAAFERNAHFIWFRDEYSQAYNAIIAQNYKKIGMQLYGHGHTDSFRLIKDASGKAKLNFLNF